MRNRNMALTSLAGACCLGALACSSSTEAVLPLEPGPIVSQLALRDSLRTLWVEHVSWTRGYLMSAIGELPDADVAAGRLLKNQSDLGNALKPFYGALAGDGLTTLLKDHITVAVDVVAAAKAGDVRRLADAKVRWEANADAIATFLARSNPAWPLADLKAMMRAHLDQTLAEATARLTRDWTADVTAYDAIVAHVLRMADALSDGIAAQFPSKVSSSAAVSAANQDLHRAMRGLWMDHVGWTRIYLISAIADLPDADAAAERLLRNQTDLGNAVKPYYGTAAGDALTVLLRSHIAIAVEIVAAAKAGVVAVMSDDVAARASFATSQADAEARWIVNADAIAAFLARANPNWPLADLKAMMRMHLDQTLAEATARLRGDWAGDIKAYEAVTDHALRLADALSDGLSKQFR